MTTPAPGIIDAAPRAAWAAIRLGTDVSPPATAPGAATASAAASWSRRYCSTARSNSFNGTP
ncbi:hypothetical protein [Streptomyces sp. NPDC059631]|uniref:hypothetical protein n=1 Tax=unclassified Streptomyces TaxID=2593676 RepID=UPI0036B6DDC8